MRKWKLLVVLPLLLSLLLGCSRREAPVIGNGSGTVGGRLMCLTGSEDEALELARLYGIELISYSNGVAVFYTEEEPAAVIQRGREQGWTELVPDGISHSS